MEFSKFLNTSHIRNNKISILTILYSYIDKYTFIKILIIQLIYLIGNNSRYIKYKFG